MDDATTHPADAASRLEAAGDALLGGLRELPVDLAHWKPAPDVWSVMEILCHVGEFVPYWTGQTRQIVERPDEPWGRTHTDTARLDAVARAATRSLEDVEAEIREGVRVSAAWLRNLHDRALDAEATSRNPRWGLKSAAFVVEHLLIEHVEKHLGQVRRNARQFTEREAGR